MILRKFYKSIIISFTICSVFNVENCNASDNNMHDDDYLWDNTINNIESTVSELFIKIHKFSIFIYSNKNNLNKESLEQCKIAIQYVKNIIRYMHQYIIPRMPNHPFAYEDIDIIKQLIAPILDERTTENLSEDIRVMYSEIVKICESLIHTFNDIYEF